jgi:hypothetical protein
VHKKDGFFGALLLGFNQRSGCRVQQLVPQQANARVDLPPEYCVRNPFDPLRNFGPRIQ